MNVNILYILCSVIDWATDLHTLSKWLDTPVKWVYGMFIFKATYCYCKDQIQASPSHVKQFEDLNLLFKLRDICAIHEGLQRITFTCFIVIRHQEFHLPVSFCPIGTQVFARLKDKGSPSFLVFCPHFICLMSMKEYQFSKYTLGICLR